MLFTFNFPCSHPSTHTFLCTNPRTSITNASPRPPALLFLLSPLPPGAFPFMKSGPGVNFPAVEFPETGTAFVHLPQMSNAAAAAKIPLFLFFSVFFFFVVLYSRHSLPTTLSISRADYTGFFICCFLLRRHTTKRPIHILFLSLIRYLF